MTIDVGRDHYINTLRQLEFDANFQDHIRDQFRYDYSDYNRSRTPLFPVRQVIRNYLALLHIAAGSNSFEGIDYYYLQSREYKYFYLTRIGLLNITTRELKNSDIVLIGCSTQQELESSSANLEYFISQSDMTSDVRELTEFQLDGCKFFAYSSSRVIQNEQIKYDCVAVFYKNRTVNMEDAYQMATNAYMFVKYNELCEKLNIPEQYRECVHPANVVWENETSIKVPQEIINGRQAIIEAEQRARAEREAEEARRREEEIRNARAKLVETSLSALSEYRMLEVADKAFKSLKEKIDQIQSDIRSYETNLNTLYAKLEAAQHEYNAYLFNSGDRVQPITEQLKAFITPGGVIREILTTDGGQGLKFIVASPIVYWEEDEIEQWKNADYGKYFPYIQLITSGRYQLLTSCCILFSNTGSVSGGSITTTEEDIKAIIQDVVDTIPHPHVGRYSCFGNNERDIRSYITKNDYQSAINTAIQCAAQLNLTDGCVVRTLCDNLEGRYNNVPCFLDTQDGSRHTPSELINAMRAVNNSSDDDALPF